MTKKTKKTTIIDICRETGLSLGTISKYLNGGTLKDKNRILVEEAIKRLDYNVDLYARSMITKRTNTVGVAIPEIGNAFYGLFCSYLDKQLKKYNLEMIVKETFNEPDKERDTINWFIERRIDEVVCFSTGIENTDFYQNLNFKRIIFVDNKIEGVDYDFFGINNYEISKKATDYLISYGHTKIAGVFVNDTYTSNERIRGFIDSFKENNITLDKDLIVYNNENLEYSCNQIRKIIDNKDITAIYTSNYIATLAALFILNEKGIKVPDSLSLFGFDNIMLTNIYSPIITIVTQPLEEMATQIVERIVEKYQNENLKPISRLLKCSVIFGDSIKKNF